MLTGLPFYIFALPVYLRTKERSGYSVNGVGVRAWIVNYYSSLVYQEFLVERELYIYIY